MGGVGDLDPFGAGDTVGDRRRSGVDARLIECSGDDERRDADLAQPPDRGRIELGGLDVGVALAFDQGVVDRRDRPPHPGSTSAGSRPTPSTHIRSSSSFAGAIPSRR